MSLDPGTRLGHYEVISLLGKGGMGEVYLAQDVRLGRRVALKVLPATSADDQDSLARFIREAKAASALNHPNIITIHYGCDARAHRQRMLVGTPQYMSPEQARGLADDPLRQLAGEPRVRALLDSMRLPEPG